jgi:hypothetical protein
VPEGEPVREPDGLGVAEEVSTLVTDAVAVPDSEEVGVGVVDGVAVVDTVEVGLMGLEPV